MTLLLGHRIHLLIKACHVTPLITQLARALARARATIPKIAKTQFSDEEDEDIGDDGEGEDSDSDE